MAPVYGVTHQQVSDEAPNLFAGGFTQATKPTAEKVDEWLTVADSLVALTVYGTTGIVASATDPSAPLARQYIRMWTLAQVMRAVYAGRAPTEIEEAAASYESAAKAALLAVTTLGGQAVGTGAATARVRGEDGTLVRGMLVDDVDLHAEPRSLLSPWAGPVDGITSSGRRGRY